MSVNTDDSDASTNLTDNVRDLEVHTQGYDLHVDLDVDRMCCVTENARLTILLVASETGQIGCMV